jgi:hypothetical protein
VTSTHIPSHCLKTALDSSVAGSKVHLCISLPCWCLSTQRKSDPLFKLQTRQIISSEPQPDAFFPPAQTTSQILGEISIEGYPLPSPIQDFYSCVNRYSPLSAPLLMRVTTSDVASRPTERAEQINLLLKPYISQLHRMIRSVSTTLPLNFSKISYFGRILLFQ